MVREGQERAGSWEWGAGNFLSAPQETWRAPCIPGAGPFSESPWHPGPGRGHRPWDPSPKSPFNSFSRENFKNLIMSHLHSKIYEHFRPLVISNIAPQSWPPLTCSTSLLPEAHSLCQRLHQASLLPSSSLWPMPFPPRDVLCTDLAPTLGSPPLLTLCKCHFICEVFMTKIK